jgi:hypothetical protein
MLTYPTTMHPIPSQVGFTVDLYEPHPKYRFCKGTVMTADEYSALIQVLM